MSNVIGKKFTISIFGESHGPAIGVVLGGVPGGITLNWDEILRQMARRAPGNDSWSTPRKEADIPRVLSGLHGLVTTGAPICAIIENTNMRSSDYTGMPARPGHADITAYFKYKGYAERAGGGHFSGRITAGIVFAGAVACQFLKEQGISIGAHIKSIGTILDDSIYDQTEIDLKLIDKLNHMQFPVVNESAGDKMQERIIEAKSQLDSIGGTIETFAIGLPMGLGEPFFDSVESVLAHLMFSIPAVKAVEFGKGFELCTMCGSQSNDPMRMLENRVSFQSNAMGGILGGITSGAPLIMRVGIKPTPTIGTAQNTVTLDDFTDTQLQAHGRHDPCIVPRALPVTEAMMAIGLMDFILIK